MRPLDCPGFTPARRRALTFTLVTLLAAGGRAIATEDPRPAGELFVPSETCQGLWIVPMTIGAGEALRLVLDTGAEATSVDPDAVRRISRRDVQPGRTVRWRDTRLGPLTIRELAVKVHEMDTLERAIGARIDGILGMDAFEDALLILDYPAGEVRVARGSLPPVDDRTVFADLGRRRPFLGVRLGSAILPVLVDSGSTRGLTLRRDDPIDWETAPRPVGASVRYRTIDINHAGRARHTLGFGPRTLERPIVGVVETTTRLAGYDALRHFAWTFDRRSRRLRIVAGGDGPIVSEPLPGTGLALRPRETGLEAGRVLPDTPAAGAGIREGDLILAIDGRSVAERGCESVARPGGESVSLTVLRNGETLEIPVPIAVLVP